MDPFLGEIRIFGGNYPPRGWAMCDGQILPISQNTALFSLLGTQFGGDGVKTFGLPDLRERFPMHWGQGPGLSSRVIGEVGGSATVSLNSNDLPSHTHPALAASAANSASPSASALLAPVTNDALVFGPQDAPTPMDPATIGLTGGSKPHDNVQPYLQLSFIIALQGIYPPRP